MRRIKPQESKVPEWGNPAWVKPRHVSGEAGEPLELKHLSRARKREDSASSGERKRRSPNRSLRRPGLLDLQTLRKLEAE